MTRKQKLKLLKKDAIESGWADSPEGVYPTTIAGRWLIEVHPEIMKEFMKWFDENVRIKK